MELDENVLNFWYSSLRDLSQEAFSAALYEIIKKEKFFPTMSVIRQYALPHHERTLEQNKKLEATPAQRMKAKHNIRLIMQVMAGEITKHECDRAFLLERDPAPSPESFNQQVGKA